MLLKSRDIIKFASPETENTCYSEREKVIRLETRGIGFGYILFLLLLLLLLLTFLGLQIQHMEVPRLGVELELQLPAYTMATATPDLSRICNLHLSSQQCRVLDPLSEARDQTCILIEWVVLDIFSSGSHLCEFLK